VTIAALPVEFASTAPGAPIAATGVALTATLFDALAEQLPFETVTLYVVVADCETVIVCDVAPVDHAYVEKPGPASRTNGVFGQTEVGPAMATVRPATIGTVVLPVEEQEPAFTVTPSVTLPDAPAVKVMLFVFVALVIAPLVIVHA
jgi:hypothetical protein